MVRELCWGCGAAVLVFTGASRPEMLGRPILDCTLGLGALSQITHPPTEDMPEVHRFNRFQSTLLSENREV